MTEHDRQHQGDWVTVRREPTAGMIVAGQRAMPEARLGQAWAPDVWEAMTAASPTPPPPSGDLVEEIARIIDPEAFVPEDRRIANGFGPGASDGSLERRDALAKARQIAARQVGEGRDQGSCGDAASDVVKGEEAPSGPESVHPQVAALYEAILRAYDKADLFCDLHYEEAHQASFERDKDAERRSMGAYHQINQVIDAMQPQLAEVLKWRRKTAVRDGGASTPSTTNLSSSPHEQNTPSTPAETPEAALEGMGQRSVSPEASRAAGQKLNAWVGSIIERERAALRAETPEAIGDEVVRDILGDVWIDAVDNALNIKGATSQEDSFARALSALHQAGKPADGPSPEADGWRPIESAPKDGTRVLAYWPHLAHPVVAWVQHGRRDPRWTAAIYGAFGTKITPQPTHWQPLAAAPYSDSEQR